MPGTILGEKASLLAGNSGKNEQNQRWSASPRLIIGTSFKCQSPKVCTARSDHVLTKKTPQSSATGLAGFVLEKPFVDATCVPCHDSLRRLGRY